MSGNRLRAKRAGKSGLAPRARRRALSRAGSRVAAANAPTAAHDVDGIVPAELVSYLKQFPSTVPVAMPFMPMIV